MRNTSSRIIDDSLLGTLAAATSDLGILGSPQNFGVRISYDF